MRTGRRELIRDLNRVLVLNLVRDNGALSRADIARLAGLSPSTVTSIAASLLEDGLLVEDVQAAGGASPVATGVIGRPATLLRIDPSAGHVVGVKLAPDSLTATVTDLDATPLAMASLPHGPRADHDAVGDLFASAVERVLAAAGLDEEVLLGVGVGVPGTVEPASGAVTRSPLPDWAGEDLRDLLQERLDLPVLVDNDVNTLTIAEQLFGAGRGLSNLVVLTVGRGIGMGLVVDGRLARGARGGAGEVGHVVMDPAGPSCWCGRSGCLEALAAEPALVREVLARTGRLLAPEELADAAAGEPAVATVLAEAGRLVGHAVASIATVVDPQRVIVSGEGVRLGPIYLDALRAGLAERLRPDDAVDLVVEAWGDDAWARGAATLVLRELFHPAFLRDEGHPSGGVVTPWGSSHSRQARMGRGGSRR
jgi:N-acetylglucosamine repressor